VIATATAAELTMDGANKQTHAIKYKGVESQAFSKYHGFVARIHIFGTSRRYYLGVFATAEEAARAADLAYLASRGRGTKTNFPAEQYTDEDIAAARTNLKEPRKTMKGSQYKGVEFAGSWG